MRSRHAQPNASVDSTAYDEGVARGSTKELKLLDWSFMDHSMDGKAQSSGKKLSPCDVEALKKCLEENKGDYVKCQAQIEAFKSSCSLKKPPPSPRISS
ncbi:unnamed protein product [Musa hybrid cultivar]